MTSARRVATDDGPEAVADVGGLFDQYAPQLWRYCARRIGPDLAEDVVGEVFLVVARNPDRIAAGESVRAWLYGIAINQLRSRRRAELRALRALERTGVDPLGGATGSSRGTRPAVPNGRRGAAGLSYRRRPGPASCWARSTE